MTKRKKTKRKKNSSTPAKLKNAADAFYSLPSDKIERQYKYHVVFEGSQPQSETQPCTDNCTRVLSKTKSMLTHLYLKCACLVRTEVVVVGVVAFILGVLADNLNMLIF